MNTLRFVVGGHKRQDSANHLNPVFVFSASVERLETQHDSGCETGIVLGGVKELAADEISFDAPRQ